MCAQSLAFAQELDACAIDQQLQWQFARLVALRDLPGFPAPAHCAEVRHRPIQFGQPQQTVHHGESYPQRLAKQALDAHGELVRCVRKPREATAFAAGHLKPLHGLIQPHRLGARALNAALYAFQFVVRCLARFSFSLLPSCQSASASEAICATRPFAVAPNPLTT